MLSTSFLMSLKSTIEYLGEWEKLYNPNFNCTEFDTIRNAAGSNNYVLSVKAWIQRTGAIGIMAKAGRKRIRDAAFFLIIMLVTFAATLLKPQKYVSSRTIQKCVEHVSTST